MRIVPPTINLFPSAVRDVVKGETLFASCQASADPLPVILWFRGGQLLTDNGNQSRVTVSVQQGSDNITTRRQLTVTNFTSQDMGVYLCMAVNSLGNVTRSFQVNAVGKSAVLYLIYFYNHHH